MEVFMKNELRRVRILVASPSDVEEDRKIISYVIEEINLTWPDTYNVYLEIVDWHKYSYPDVSSDPQAVINKQLPIDYDIFLALFWTRIGSPTPRAISGTIEEFERAYNKWKDNPNQLHIMVYFKITQLSPDIIDAEQLIKLQQFKKSLSDRGILYFTFDKSEEFSQLLRVNISRLLREIITVNPNSPSQEIATRSTLMRPPTSEITPKSISEDEGFLDSVEKSVFASERVTQVLRHFSEEMELMTSYTNKANEELGSIDPNSSSSLQERKRLINNLADMMEDFVSRTSPDLLIFNESFSSAMENYSYVMTILPDFGVSAENLDQLIHALAALSSLREKMIEFKESITSVRETVSRLPRITTQFNRARKRYIENLDNFISILTNSIIMIPQIEKTAVEIIAEYKKRLLK
jgi:hypothetical protein